MAAKQRPLTSIQRHVADAHIAGQSAAQIATALGLTESTIRSKLAAMRRGIARRAYLDLDQLLPAQQPDLFSSNPREQLIASADAFVVRLRDFFGPLHPAVLQIRDAISKLVNV